MSDEIAVRAHDIAYSQLRSQKDDLRNLRSQAQLSAAVSGLVASVFVGLARLNTTLSVECSKYCFLGISSEFWLVIVCFFSAIGFSALAALSWKTCTFDLDPKRYLHAVAHDKDNKEFYCDMATAADTFFDQNEVVLDETKGFLQLSFLFSILQIPAWMVLVF